MRPLTASLFFLKEPGEEIYLPYIVIYIYLKFSVSHLQFTLLKDNLMKLFATRCSNGTLNLPGLFWLHLKLHMHSI